MPTEPLKNILDRDMSREMARPLVQVASPLLKELVNYSTNALARCADSAEGEENEDGAPLALYRHMIEFVDGMEVLVSHSCGTPAIPLLRSCFEALLALEYMFERDYVNRSLSWLAVYVRKRVASYELLDPETANGKQFLRAATSDKVARDVTLPEATEVREAVAGLRSVLTRTQFEPVLDELADHKKRGNRNVPWYGLFGGPGNLEQLARHLGRPAQYEILYRQWSRVLHAGDFSRFVTMSSDGEGGIRPLREPDAIRNIASFAATFMLDATRKMLKKFRPGEETSLRKWYEREVRRDYLRVIKP